MHIPAAGVLVPVAVDVAVGVAVLVMAAVDDVTAVVVAGLAVDDEDADEVLTAVLLAVEDGLPLPHYLQIGPGAGKFNANRCVVFGKITTMEPWPA
jgi:hypothetical protein